MHHLYSYFKNLPYEEQLELEFFLRKLVVPQRNNLFDNLIQNRTRYITVVLEDIFQPHNASAVLRSADCFGVQDVHVIENKNQYVLDTEVSMSANQWINIFKYNQAQQNTLATINSLKRQGYRIVATTPHAETANLEHFDIGAGKFALMFGTERNGLSDVALENADESVKIPMFGFVESFNISVSASIILHTLRMKLNQSEVNWQLSPKEKTTVLLQWLVQTIKRPELVLQRYFQQQAGFER